MQIPASEKYPYNPTHPSIHPSITHTYTHMHEHHTLVHDTHTHTHNFPPAAATCMRVQLLRLTHHLFHDRLLLLLLGDVWREHSLQRHRGTVRPERLEVVVRPALGGHDVHDDVPVVEQDPSAFGGSLPISCNATQRM